MEKYDEEQDIDTLLVFVSWLSLTVSAESHAINRMRASTAQDADPGARGKVTRPSEANSVEDVPNCCCVIE